MHRTIFILFINDGRPEPLSLIRRRNYSCRMDDTQRRRLPISWSTGFVLRNSFPGCVRRFFPRGKSVGRRVLAAV
jgi:hypothetical protein